MKTHPVICLLSVSGSAFDLLTSPERYKSCSLSCSWVFIHEKAYQTSDTGIESSVMTKVKGFGYHHNQVMDVADYVFPSQVGNARGDNLFFFNYELLDHSPVTLNLSLSSETWALSLFQGAAVFCIITKLLVTDSQFQGNCREVRMLQRNGNKRTCAVVLISTGNQ